MFKVNDVVRLTQSAKDQFLGYYKNDPDSHTLFSTSMVVVELKDRFGYGGSVTQECGFRYPATHRNSKVGGGMFYWPFKYLELVSSPPPSNICKCEIKVLMLRGCKCHGA